MKNEMEMEVETYKKKNGGEIYGERWKKNGAKMK